VVRQNGWPSPGGTGKLRCVTPDQLQVRVFGDASLPTLVYFPGVHGNCLLIGGFRAALAGRLRFVEITYPLTVTWTLDDHAAAVEKALAEHGITSGWLLGESFGSQVVWPMVARKRFGVEGVVLAGGFARHPYQRAIPMVEKLGGGLPFMLVARILQSYASVTLFRFRHSPETRMAVREFIANVTNRDRLAGKHRLQLIGRYDPNPILRETTLPVYALSGCFDPLVPWFILRPTLKRRCPGLRAYRIIWASDHNVLGTASKASADQIVEWITRERSLAEKCSGHGKQA
jgi:pimeloyl-ACP methyl ester carboxylesterase